MGVKALGMVSGGLDSTLATKILLDLGLEVEGIYFSTGFCVTEHTRNFKADDKPIRPNEALRLGADLGISVHIVDVSKDYLPVVTNPKYGYGANLNPCIDCRIFMFKRMKGLMDRFGAQFMYTGEVLGQRPMSQHREAMKTIERDSGLGGLVLRPLSAQVLDPTIPEVKGWVDRSKLLDIVGRSRKTQTRLAGEWKIENTPQPAGGCCYLTDPQYAARLRDIFDHKGKENLNQEDTLLLKAGRHFRVANHIKVIVGRNEKENNFLKYYEKGRHVFLIPDFPSAHVLAEIEGEAHGEELGLLASIAARYSDAPKGAPVGVHYRYGGEERVIEALPVEENRLERWRI
ncbi:MAG: hypothetical protein HY593_01790 [Candidatus Omnitrophica bacterium]|nr:hypothetical protein [Candidatus Omnitrophota bacterium]